MSLTKLLNWCLGRSLWYVSEDSLDPNLCGIKTNRVNIFLAVYIPDLNISKHVKLTFLHRSLQGPCRLRLPRNPVELALLGRGSIPEDRQSSEQPARSSVSQLCRSAWQRELVGPQVYYLLIATDGEGGTLCPRSLLPSLERLLFPFYLFPEKCQAPAMGNLCFLS